MEPLRVLAFSLLIGILSASNAFQIIKVEPREAGFYSGSKLRLTCDANNWYERCKFMHKNRSCEFRWNRKPAIDCTDFNSPDYERARFVGDDKEFECVLELDNLQLEGMKY